MAARVHRQLLPLKRNTRTNEVYLQLPAPHENIIITPPRLSDASTMTECLNDARVYSTLVGPPYPYSMKDAESWIASSKGKSDALLDTLNDAATNDEQKGDESSTPSALVNVGGCPVSHIREVQEDGTDIFLGPIDVIRHGQFACLRDKEQQTASRKRNEELPVGSPEIIWDFGFYLAPSHHGKGIMSAALHTIIHEWAIPRMNAHKIYGTAFKGNTGSVKVFLKNGFKLFDLVEDCVTISESKGGGMTGLNFLEWTHTN